MTYLFQLRRWPLLTIALLMPGLVAVALSQQPTKSASAKHTVIIKHFQNTPETLKVHRGETVIWLNRDIVPHTVTDSGGVFDSGQFAPGKSWKFVTSKPGTFHYTCTLHPNMQGTLIVGNRGS